MRGEAVVVVDCRGRNGNCRGLWRVETSVTPSVSFSIPARRRALRRQFRFKKLALLLKDPRVDGSERGGLRRGSPERSNTGFSNDVRRRDGCDVKAYLLHRARRLDDGRKERP